MFSCSFCAKRFKSRTSLNVHILSHTKEKPHNCPQCPSAFGQPSRLAEHIKSVHDGIKQIRHRNSHCPMCSYKCYNKTMLRNHLRKHSAELSFSCNIPNCGFKTKHAVSLLRHGRTVHCDERSYECPTDGCNYKGKTKDRLRCHLRIHSNENNFACTVPGCNYTCKLKHYLLQHIIRAHSDEKPFKCSTCNFCAKSRSELLQHELTHKNIKSFQCQAPNCRFASHQRHNVKRHFDAKHTKKDMRCIEPGCNYTCGSLLLLNIHLKNHGRPMLKCTNNSCNFSTRFKSSLLKHMSRHHKDFESAMGVGRSISDPKFATTANATETLRCRSTNCGYKTKFPHRYDRHTIAHRKEENRKHVCPFCFSRFSYLYPLKDHIQRHIGEKPYSCSLCKYTAVADGSELSKHAKQHHNIHVFPRVEGDGLRKCRACGKTCWGYCEFVLHSMNHLQPVVVLQQLRVNVM